MASVMIKCSEKFIIPRFKELCDAIMNHIPSKKNKSNLIMIQIIKILPQVANVFPDAFAETYVYVFLVRVVCSFTTIGVVTILSVTTQPFSSS